MDKATQRWQRLTWLITASLLLILLLADAAGGLLHRQDHGEGPLALWDVRSSDWLLRQEARHRAPDPGIVMIQLDQKSLEQIDAAMGDRIGAWPWPRAVHAELISDIEQQGPRAIVFDMMFNEADEARADSDRALRDTVSQFSNIYFASVMTDNGQGWPLIKAPPLLGLMRSPDADPAATAPIMGPNPDIVGLKGLRIGLINFDADGDGIGRHARLFTNIGGWQIPSLAARVALDQGWLAPDLERIRLNWYHGAFPRFSYSDVIHDFSLPHPTLPASTFAGKIVIIGASAPGLADYRPTSLSASQPGTEVIGTTLSNIHDGDWLRDLPSRPVLLLVLLPAVAWDFTRRRSALRTGLLLAATTLLVLGGGYLLLARGHYFAPVSVALLGAWLLFATLTVTAQLLERREREAAISIFSRFMDPRVVGELVRSGEISRQQKPQSREISILFSDIRGFTTLSETRTPEAVIELLNRYFNAQVAVIFKYGGTLDKFIGDAIMAFWNAPTDDPDHAVNATRAAMEMATVLDDFKRELMTFETGLEGFDIGIGIHTGPAVVGFLGADMRLDYTAIGDTVNLASRIEGCTKGVSRVLVSGATRAACGERIVFKDHGEFHVKGRSQGVELFEPLSAGATKKT